MSTSDPMGTVELLLDELRSQVEHIAQLEGVADNERRYETAMSATNDAADHLRMALFLLEEGWA